MNLQDKINNVIDRILLLDDDDRIIAWSIYSKLAIVERFGASKSIIPNYPELYAENKMIEFLEGNNFDGSSRSVYDDDAVAWDNADYETIHEYDTIENWRQQEWIDNLNKKIGFNNA
jgi:hypothetical protein|tara:strand:+ start:593 stop:943 length:351 start_codon:yes stop_codon:yes gene_type:complete